MDEEKVLALLRRIRDFLTTVYDYTDEMLESWDEPSAPEKLITEIEEVLNRE